MLKNITLGQYFPIDSVIHRLDPRTKILLLFCVIIIIFIIRTFFGYAVLLFLLVMCVILSKVNAIVILKSLKPVLFIIIFTFVLNIFFLQEGDTLIKIWFLNVTPGGLNRASFLALRLMFLVMFSTFLTLTTSPIQFTDAIESLLRPLNYVKFPVHEMALMMTIALKFIPVLVEETDKIMSAQMARGANFSSGNIFKRIYGMVPILIPLFVCAFRRADELAQAMESRCYMGGHGRTRLKQLKYSHRDFIAYAVFLAIAIPCGVLL